MELTKHNFMTEFKKWIANKDYRPFWLSNDNIHAFVRYENSFKPQTKNLHRIINMRVHAKVSGRDLRIYNKEWLNLQYVA